MAKPIPPRSSDKIDVALVLLLTLLVALGPLSISFYVSSLPAIGRDLGADSSLVQKTLTVYLAGFALGQLFFGPLSDRYGRRPVMFCGLIAYIAATIFCAMAWDISALLIGRFLQGLAACVAPVVGRAVVRDMFEGKAAIKAFSLIGAVIGLAPAIGPAIGGLIQEGFGWRANFIALTCMALVITVWVGAKLGETIRERNMDALQPRRLIGNYAGLLANRSYMAYVGVVSLGFCGMFAYTTDASFLFISAMGLRESIFGLLIVFTTGAFVTGNITGSRLIASGLVRGPVLIRIGIAIELVGGLLMLWRSPELSILNVVAPMMVYMIGFGMVLPAGFAGALQPFPRVAGSASAMLGCMQMGLGAVTSAVAATLYQGTAHSLAGIMIFAAVAGFLVFLILPRSQPGAI